MSLGLQLEDLLDKVALLVIQPDFYVKTSSRIPIEIVKEWGMEVVFVSANKPFSTIKELLSESCVIDKIIFVDCASSLAGETPEGDRVLFIENPANLTSITIGITKGIEKLAAKGFLVFDSLTTLLIYNQVDSLTMFAHTLGVRMKALGVTCLLLAVEQEASKEMLRFLSTITDKIIRIGDDKEGTQILA